jgi:hypothetical protein
MNVDFNSLLGITATSTSSSSETTTSNKTVGQPTKDDIEKAAEQAGLMGVFISFPQLENPSLTPNQTFQLGQQQAITNILTSWSQNTQEIAKMSDQADKQDQITQLQQQNARLAQFVLIAQFLDPSSLSGINVTVGADGNLQIVQTQSVGPSNDSAAANVSSPQQTDPTSKALQVAGSLGMAMVTFVALGSVGFSDAAFQSANTVVGSVLQGSGLTTTIDTTGAQALLASLFGTSVVYPSLGSIAGNALGKNTGSDGQQQQPTVEDAKALIQNTENFLSNPNYASKVLSTIPNSSSMPASQQSQIVGLVTLSYILTALSVAYKVETGGGTGSEIWNMATGQTPLSPTDPRNGLVGLFQQTLSSLNLSPQQLASIQTSFSTSVNSSTSFNKLSNTIGLLNSINTNGSYVNGQVLTNKNLT